MAPAEVVFFVASGLLAGMFSASIGWPIVAVLAIVLCVEGCFAYLRRAPWWRGAIIMGAILCGAFYFHLYGIVSNSRQVMPQGEAFTGIIVSEPAFTPKTQYFDLRLESPFAGKVRVVADQSREFRYGDRISVSGTVALSSYRGRAGHESVFPEIQIISSGNGAWAKHRLLEIKYTALGVFKRTLPHDESALLSGITLGHRSDFSSELKERMTRSGTTHLVALSGYNISILAIVAAGFFGAFFRRRMVFALTILMIVGFVLMVGAEASVVRAAIMGFLVLLAREAGRIYRMRNAIALTAFAMALHDPSILAFDVGFQLSFLSLIGIVLVEPALRSILGWGDGTSFLGWKENLLTTIAAQVAVLPMLVGYFGDASLMAFFANILILSVVPFTMALGFLLAAVGAWFAALGTVFAYLVRIPLTYILGVITLAAAVPASLGGVFSTSWFVVLYYASLIGVVYYAQHHGPKSA